MKKSVKKFYGHKRMWDFEDFQTQTQKKIVKRRAHRRLRHQLQKEAYRGFKSILAPFFARARFSALKH